MCTLKTCGSTPQSICKTNTPCTTGIHERMSVTDIVRFCFYSFTLPTKTMVMVLR